MTASNDSHTDSLDRKVGQKVRSCRLAKRYTQKDLASKIGTKYQVILQYEKGKRKISIRKLYSIAEALSVSIIDLIPEHTISNEESYLESEGLDLVEKYEKIENQELRNVVYSLITSAQASKENSRKVARIEVAKNLVKAGVSVDTIFQATGLSTEEYSNAEEKTTSVDYRMGQRIKKLRITRKYTQEDLAKKISTTRQKISDYEQGNIAAPLEKLYEIAKALSVSIKDLLTRRHSEASSGLIEKYREIEDQELRNGFYVLIKSLSEGMEIIAGKVKKAEKAEIAKNLRRLGISIDIVSRTTGATELLF
ncbi:WO male-killing family protein Wmk [Wolbachia endosymbiont of Oedothorax gibbosus]|uniref:WO male-killing family protein Wmk n=1 Tax=Wolbachia endosymbiont of Oedothorax gibbosus TaxID=931100 RepID=UPI002023E195|nr:helix-turn-helix transcriptional regulator [Wolbachia endosymbiont of Oedothorax gibbosus]